jgi:hypothetical protein
MKKWAFILLLLTTNVFGQVPLYLGIRSGYFVTAGIQLDAHPVSLVFGYRLPGGWLSLGNNTRIGGLANFEIPLFKMSDRKNYLSLNLKSGIYAAQADYTRSEGRLQGMKFWPTGLTGGIGLKLKWHVLEFKATIMPGYELSKYHEWRKRFFFWRCTGANLSLQLN